ncbi:NADH-quinone oxidoreductase subunit N [Buchnera aphidicola]|uniref:NADH-quinone oxidoreductase subunit N n=1 Tax=Buchnera aphidicola TaxID=9 RepID=UPI003464C8F9
MMINFQQLIGFMPFVIALLTVLVLLCFISLKRNHFIIYSISIIGLLFSILSLYFVYDVVPIDISMLFYINQGSIFYIGIILFSTLASVILAYPYLSNKMLNKEEFYLFLFFSTLGCMSIVISNHMSSLFVSIELMSLPMLGLIGYEYCQRKTLEAVLKYMILSGIASSFLLFGIALIYAVSGNLSFISLVSIINVHNLLQDNDIVFLLGFFLILVALSFKLSIIPFHLWAPDVYEGTSYTSLFFLSTSSKIAIFSILSRLFMYFPKNEIKLLYLILELLAFFSIFFGNIMALFQKKLKRLLAYSSISHFGYMLIALVLINNEHISLEATAIIFISYILTNFTILGLVNRISIQYNLYDTDILNFYRGLFWKSPIIAVLLTIMMFSLAGLPMSIGFIGKFYLILLTINEKSLLLGLIMVVGSAVGFYYYLQIIINFYLTPLKYTEYSVQNVTQYNFYSVLIFISSLMVVLFGIFPEFLIDLLKIIQQYI